MRSSLTSNLRNDSAGIHSVSLKTPLKAKNMNMLRHFLALEHNTCNIFYPGFVRPDRRVRKFFFQFHFYSSFRNH